MGGRNYGQRGGHDEQHETRGVGVFPVAQLLGRESDQQDEGGQGPKREHPWCFVAPEARVVVFQQPLLVPVPPGVEREPQQDDQKQTADAEVATRLAVQQTGQRDDPGHDDRAQGLTDEFSGENLAIASGEQHPYHPQQEQSAKRRYGRGVGHVGKVSREVKPSRLSATSPPPSRRDSSACANRNTGRTSTS